MFRHPAFALCCALAAGLASAGRAQTALHQIQTPREDDQTLIEGRLENGGYGGPRLVYGRIAAQDAMLVGGEGGWIVNHQFILGGAGYGLVTNQPAPGVFAPTNDLTMGYGGVLLGYTLLPHSLVHPTFTVLIGAGGLGTKAHRGGGTTDLQDSFFVLEPAVTVDLNVAKHFRWGLSLSYRWVRGVETDGLSNNDLCGLYGSTVLKFGVF